jgi:glucose/arabinose dehydrogenase
MKHVERNARVLNADSAFGIHHSSFPPRAAGKQKGLRPRLRRGSRLVLALGGMLLTGLAGGCATGPHVLSRAQQAVIDRQYVEYPAGYEFRRYIAGLNAPIAFDFDVDGNIIIVEGGLGNNRPSIIGFRPDGTKFVIFPLAPSGPLTLGSESFEVYGPVGGLACYHGKVYLSHRDKDGFGVITAFDYYGGHRTVVSGLPARGENGVTQLAVDPKSGLLYFGVGTATNSGVVGLDDAEIGWLGDYPKVCDNLGLDKVRTYGAKFNTPDPFATWFMPDIAVTGPFQPFNVSNQTLIRSRSDKANGVICSVPLLGGPLRIEATGIHNPRGLAFSQFGLYFTNDGMEPRGSRPIMNDGDSVLVWVPGTWYGWPDFSTDLRPINEPSGHFQPPQSMVLPYGYPDVDMLVNKEASNLVVPSANTLLEGVFPSQSGAAGLTFIPDASPLSTDFAGNAIVALSGDRAPFGTGGMKLVGPTGYKIMRLDVDRKQVHEFIHNTQELPASKIKNATPEELERPIDVKIGPDGALYVLDLGQMTMKHGKPDVAYGTGQVFRLLPVPPPLGTTNVGP